MGFLAPLYMMGFLAIGVPILLHLIKRTPQGRQMFSSLMFLTPSPPRITKRSRLSNILLLILRALAFAALALAFARPFFNFGRNTERLTSSGRRIIFLLDASASMKRPDLWNEARNRIDGALGDIQPADEVGLYYFDRQMHPALTMGEWNQSDPASRLSLFRSHLADIKPSWSGTRIGDALAAAGDLASENNSASSGEGKVSRQIIVVSDFQEGGKLQALMGHEWPKEVGVRTIPVAAKQPGNASIQWAAPAVGEAGTVAADGNLRVNLTNQSDSVLEQFTLTWSNEKGAVPGDPIQAYVPAGRSQVIKIPLPPDGSQADRLVLSGDNCDFDNTLFIVPPHTDTVRVLYVGDDPATDVNALRYYLENALFNTPQRKLEITGRSAGEALVDADLVNTRLAVVTGAPPEATITRLGNFAQGGGDVLWVGKDLATAQGIGSLLGRELQVKEATGDYSLISRIETSHPLFSPFADPRFGDFTKIHFWKHRQVRWADAADSTVPLNVLAAFDNGDPYLIEANLGKGTVRLMTSGWQPSDSQLAVSSKFLPLMEEMIRRKDMIAVGSQYSVDDPIAIPAAQRDGEITGPDGKAIKLASTAVFNGDDKPGIYHLQGGGQAMDLAVNLAAEESLTIPIGDPGAELETWGVRLTSPESVQQLADRERQLLNNEVENRQKSWRWLLLGVLGLLAIETALAGRLSGGVIRERAAA